VRLLFWLLAIPCLALGGAFAAVNVAPLTLRIWPLPFEVTVPIYGAVLGAFFSGCALSALYYWVSGVPGWFARRRGQKRERALEAETQRLQTRLSKIEQTGHEPPGDPGFDLAPTPQPSRIRRLLASGNE
jgi:hypothetical protein